MLANVPKTTRVLHKAHATHYPAALILVCTRDIPLAALELPANPSLVLVHAKMLGLHNRDRGRLVQGYPPRGFHLGVCHTKVEATRRVSQPEPPPLMVVQAKQFDMLEFEKGVTGKLDDRRGMPRVHRSIGSTG